MAVQKAEVRDRGPRNGPATSHYHSPTPKMSTSTSSPGTSSETRPQSSAHVPSWSLSSFMPPLFPSKRLNQVKHLPTYAKVSIALSILCAITAMFSPSSSSSASSPAWLCRLADALSVKLSLCADDNVLGGWRLPSNEAWANFGTDKCTIDRISVLDITPERFEAEFRYNRSVIVTFPNGAADWTRPEDWSRKGLTETYSHWTIRSGESLEIVRMGGNGKHASSFAEYVDDILMGETPQNGTVEPKHYACDREFFWLSSLGSSFKLPKYFQINTTLDESIFFLGPSLSGVVFHKHSDTWNGVVYGYKRWFIYPRHRTPPGGVHHGFSLLEWVTSVYPHLAEKDKPMECIQRPGEILYLAEGNYHATLNLGDTVAVAIQKRAAVTNAEKLSYEATQLNNFLQTQEKPDPKNVYNQRLLAIYKEWHELLPESSEPVMKLGVTLLQMQNYTEALPWLIKATEMDPLFIFAYLQSALTLTELRRYQEAEKFILKAIELSPNLWDNYHIYGEFLLKMGRHEDALPIFKKGTELMPDQLPFWFYYKMCQVHLNDLEGAEATEKIIQEIKSRDE